MNKKSIYNEFSAKLIVATSLFTIIMSFMFYGFTKATVYEGVSDQLIARAKIIQKVNKNIKNYDDIPQLIIEDTIKIEYLHNIKFKNLKITQYRDFNNNHFISLLYPIDKKLKIFVKITKNILQEDEMLKKIFSNVFVLGAGGLIMIILYAFVVSKTLLHPIINISNKLSKMDEYTLNDINEKTLPIEFIPLANSINKLTNKIQSYVKYQKELFIGAAHELKTPLAVMKLKSEVTLMKSRPIEKYEEALKIHIQEINTMNNMITSLLDMGRKESAQFEKPIDIDLIKFLKEKVNNYSFLTKEKNIQIEHLFNIEYLNIRIKATLLNLIIQNFVQNAIKFAQENTKITLITKKYKNTITIKVLDEGIGIDENIDLFAPFKRIGKAQGVGLGLYLARNAANTLGGKIELINRTDGIKGCEASLTLPV